MNTIVRKLRVKVLKIHENFRNILCFMFIYAIIGTIIFRRWNMSYLFEILPSLLSGATMTLQVFALVLLFSIPLGILVAFLLTGCIGNPSIT